MNSTKIEVLKQAAAEANAAHNCQRDRLAALGLKSGERYLLLKPLKAAADAAHATYVKFTHGQISGALDAIIEADRPAREAAARARSPWKQAKFDAANARKAQGL